MKTVQECLKELDTEVLIDSYLELEMMCREMVRVMKKKGDISAKALWLKYHDYIRDYIEYMRNVQIEPSDEPSVLYVYEDERDYFHEKHYYGLIHISELLAQGAEAEDYSYTLCTHGEIAGFLVAETKRTQDNLLELMTDVLYQASFYGYTKEDQEKEFKGLDEAENEIESEDEDEPDNAFVMSGYKPPEPEHRSEEERRLEERYRKVSGELSDFLRKKALLEIIDSLCVIS